MLSNFTLKRVVNLRYSSSKFFLTLLYYIIVINIKEVNSSLNISIFQLEGLNKYLRFL